MASTKKIDTCFEICGGVILFIFLPAMFFYADFIKEYPIVEGKVDFVFDSAICINGQLYDVYEESISTTSVLIPYLFSASYPVVDVASYDMNYEELQELVGKYIKLQKSKVFEDKWHIEHIW